jgi:hypothetical protein
MSAREGTGIFTHPNSPLDPAVLLNAKYVG